MKNDVNPIALIGIIAVAVIGLAFFGYQMLKPAGYTPSPGVTSAGGRAPGTTTSPAASADEEAKHFTSAPGATPGKPMADTH